MAKKSKTRKSSGLKNRTSLKNPKLLLFVAGFAVVGAVVLAISLAAPATKGKTTPLTLTNEYWSYSRNPAAPSDCINEDDYHQRIYSGSLNGTFSATEQLCDNESSGGLVWGSGGEGLFANVGITSGTLNDMTITSPTGVVHHAVYISSSTFRNVTTRVYEACFNPQYMISNDEGTGTLNKDYPGDPWTYSISGSVNAKFTITTQMANVSLQQQNCPPSEQNLTP